MQNHSLFLWKDTAASRDTHGLYVAQVLQRPIPWQIGVRASYEPQTRGLPLDVVQWGCRPVAGASAGPDRAPGGPWGCHIGALGGPK